MSAMVKPFMDLIHVWHEWTYHSKMLQIGKAQFQASCPVKRQVLFRQIISLKASFFSSPVQKYSSDIRVSVRVAQNVKVFG